MARRQKEIPWYKNWFDENYLLLYKHRNSDDAREQAALIQRTLKPGKNCTILDLGCGEGRYMPFFKNIGCKIRGMDLSETLLRSAKTKYPLLDLVLGDMRNIPFLPAKFDLILSLFTSFGYFENDEENRQVVGSIYRCLKPGGVFWLDFLNADSIENNLVAESSYRISNSIQVLEKRKIMAGRIIKNIYFTKGAAPPAGESMTIKNYHESIRLFTRDELIEMLQQAGFQAANCFGDYRGDPWSKESERTIILGRKTN